MHVDIEFAHLYLEQGVQADSHELQGAASLASAIRDWYRGQGHTVTLSSLIDDYTSPGGDVQQAIQTLMELSPSPDSVYLESDFAAASELVLGGVKKKYLRDRITGRTFLAEGKDLRSAIEQTRGMSLFDVLGAPNDIAPSRFRFALNFDIEFMDVDGNRRLACPVLAAAWHAFRLGLTDASHVAPVAGAADFPADIAVSVLPLDYIQVEASVRALLLAQREQERQLAGRLRYVFF